MPVPDMKLAVNYSPAAAALLADGSICLDRFKTPEWLWMIAEAAPLAQVSVHFSLAAGCGKLSDTDWALIDRLLVETGTPYVNLHLWAVAADYPDMSPDTTDPAHQQRVAEQAIADVQVVAKRYGAERVIVENVPYRRAYPGSAVRPVVEAQVIHTILNETGCGLLLDISHARIAARSLGIDERAYIESLPVERLRELHFTGLHRRNGQWEDHLEALNADWVELEWVLGRVRQGAWANPWQLAFEYGGVGEIFEWRSDPAIIQAQVPRLYAMLHELDEVQAA